MGTIFVQLCSVHNLETSFHTWPDDQGRIIQGAKGGYSPGAPQDRGHTIG